jgi:hypothetical protein
MWNPFRKITQPNQPNTEPEGTAEIVITRELLAERILKRMANQQSPFARTEWHPATIEIDEEWMDGFEMLNWANALMTFIALDIYSAHTG